MLDSYRLLAKVKRRSPRLTLFPDPQMEDPALDSEMMLKVARTRMPFGKYQGRLLLDLPERYVVWFSQKGFPEGELGRMLTIVYEVKLNGLEYLFKPLK